jgi:PAS domain S-box-containing protein
VAEVNHHAAELFGSTRDDLIGRPLEDVLPGLIGPFSPARRDRGSTAGGEDSAGPGLELVGRRRDGGEVLVEVTLGVVDDTGAVSLLAVADGSGLDVAGLDVAEPDVFELGRADLEVIAVIGDRTGRRRVDADLAYLSAISESSTDAIYRQNRDGLITGWNPAAELLYGYRAEEVAGWRSTRLLAEDRWPDYEVVLRRVLAGEVHSHVETEIRRRDGVTVPVVLTMAPIRDARGRSIGASVIARDVTEQNMALAALAESEARRREGEFLAHVGGWVLDRATASVQWSEELHRIHGIEPVHFDGTLAAHVAPVHPDDRARLDGALKTAMAGGEAMEAEYRIVRPDGQVRWLKARAEPVVDERGGVIGLRGIAQDVTEFR